MQQHVVIIISLSFLHPWPGQRKSWGHLALSQMENYSQCKLPRRVFIKNLHLSLCNVLRSMCIALPHKIPFFVHFFFSTSAKQSKRGSPNFQAIGRAWGTHVEIDTIIFSQLFKARNWISRLNERRESESLFKPNHQNSCFQEIQLLKKNVCKIVQIIPDSPFHF